MKIFIGSSSEQSETMKMIAGWLRNCGHTPLCWNETIHLGQGTLIEQLIRTSREVDGAIFIFAEDDPVKTRGNPTLQPRDNVIFEYGLFMGTLGAKNVVFIRVGKAKIASDLEGIVYINLPYPISIADVSQVIEGRPKSDAQKQIELWAASLAPFYLNGLWIDLAKHLSTIQVKGRPVDSILLDDAPRLVAGNESDEIIALCSDKGEYTKAYYRPQFRWVAKKTARSIERVFVRLRGVGSGFSGGETLGIIMHLDEKPNGVAIRWIYADSIWLGGPYSSSLGFAIFGKSWIVHWGLKFGTFHDGTQHQSPPDYGVLELLKKRFNNLWEHSVSFDDSLIKDVRKKYKEMVS